MAGFTPSEISSLKDLSSASNSEVSITQRDVQSTSLPQHLMPYNPASMPQIPVYTSRYKHLGVRPGLYTQGSGDFHHSDYGVQWGQLNGQLQPLPQSAQPERTDSALDTPTRHSFSGRDRVPSTQPPVRAAGYVEPPSGPRNMVPGNQAHEAGSCRPYQHAPPGHGVPSRVRIEDWRYLQPRTRPLQPSQQMPPPPFNIPQSQPQFRAQQPQSHAGAPQPQPVFILPERRPPLTIRQPPTFSNSGPPRQPVPGAQSSLTPSRPPPTTSSERVVHAESSQSRPADVSYQDYIIFELWLTL